MSPSRYSFELWSPDGQLIADLSGRAKNRRIVQSRNEAEDIYWQIGLADLEEHAARLGLDVNNMIVVDQTEVRIRRGQTYLCGGQINFKYTRITTQTQDIEIRARGYLDLLIPRYTDEERKFTATQATQMVATLIDESQAKPNGDFGITIGSLATVGTHDNTYKAQRIKEAVQAGAEQFNFDFEFTHDKVFNTYAALGSQRPEVVFEYPGNIRELGLPDDGTKVFNHVTVLGSGSGTQGNVKVSVEDAGSQIDYRLREERINYSEIEDLNALARHGDAYLAGWSRPFEVPDLLVDGNVAPYVTDYGIGDYVNVVCNRFKSTRHLNGLYRVEKREIAIDENDSESVKLYVSR